MSTWVSRDNRSTAQKLVASVISRGPIPKHIAFVMDGFLKLREAIRWCMDMNISEITVYAFSIANFERSHEELEGLLNVIKELFSAVLQERSKGIHNGIRYQIVGDWSLIPPDMMEVMLKVMDETKDETKLNLNVAFAYSGRREITNGLKRLLDKMQQIKIELSDVNESLIENSMQRYPPTKLDLFVRTGESRLSDFMLWETSDDTIISYCSGLWPEYSYWNFLNSVFVYQVNRKFTTVY